MLIETWIFSVDSCTNHVWGDLIKVDRDAVFGEESGYLDSLAILHGVDVRSIGCVNRLDEVRKALEDRDGSTGSKSTQPNHW